VPRRETILTENPVSGEIRMATTRGSAHYAGLLPVELPDEFVRLADPKNDQSPNRQPPLGRRGLRFLALILTTFCIVVALTLAWWSYGDATRRMIANSYPQFGWWTPRRAATDQKAPDTIALAGSAAPDQQQFDEVLRDLRAMRLTLDRIAAGQELITRSIDEIATSITAGQERMTRSTDQTATSIAVGQEPTTRSTNQTAATIAAGQEEITRNTDQTATSIDQAPSKATSIPAESGTDGASLQPTARLNITPTEAIPPQTSSEKGRQSSAASRNDASCFPSASAVVQNHPGGWPSWTLRAPGHEGTTCWCAASRPRGRDHRPSASGPRREATPEKKTVGATESGAARYEWP
jgi:hypothetical protein